MQYLHLDKEFRDRVDNVIDKFVDIFAHENSLCYPDIGTKIRSLAKAIRWTAKRIENRYLCASAAALAAGIKRFAKIFTNRESFTVDSAGHFPSQRLKQALDHFLCAISTGWGIAIVDADPRLLGQAFCYHLGFINKKPSIDTVLITVPDVAAAEFETVLAAVRHIEYEVSKIWMRELCDRIGSEGMDHESS
jgi:hypothetical protein